MPAAIAAPVARAVVSAAPGIVNAVKDKAPQVAAAAREWLSKATNNAKANLTEAAANSSTAPYVLEGLVRSGHPVADLLTAIPVLTKQEAAAFRQKLLGIQADLTARGDKIAGGVVSDAVDAALKMNMVKTNVKRAMAALNAPDVTTLRIRLDAIRSITEADLEAYEVHSK